MVSSTYICSRLAQMAELVDALVSNTCGATRAGSTPALGTTLSKKPCKSEICKAFFMGLLLILAVIAHMQFFYCVNLKYSDAYPYRGAPSG